MPGKQGPTCERGCLLSWRQRKRTGAARGSELGGGFVHSVLIRQGCVCVEVICLTGVQGLTYGETRDRWDETYTRTPSTGVKRDMTWKSLPKIDPKWENTPVISNNLQVRLGECGFQHQRHVNNIALFQLNTPARPKIGA